MDESTDVGEFIDKAIESLSKVILELSLTAGLLTSLKEEENKKKPSKKVRQPPKYV